MSRLIIIPDIHEEIGRVREIEAQLHRNDRILCLGDYFDSFTHSEEKAKQVIAWIKEKLNDANPTKWTLLLGNHDVHYLWDEVERSAGWAADTARLIEREHPLFRDALRKRLILVVKEGFIFSHAGIAAEAPWLPPNRWEDVRAWLSSMQVRAKRKDQRSQHWLWQVGRSRGGRAAWGGPLWLDWQEFRDTPGYPQIVGHTPAEAPRRVGESYCLDSYLAHVGILENRQLTVVEWDAIPKIEEARWRRRLLTQ